MNGVLGHAAAWKRYTGQGTTWADEMNYGMNHAPGARPIARPVDLQSSMLPLCYSCPLYIHEEMTLITNNNLYVK